jgi:hypothetical protein
MRKKYRRRTGIQYGDSGHSLFGVTGWLFADLLLALALAFLLATTVGSTPPKTPKPQKSVRVTHTPVPTHTKQPPPLQLTPVHITFSIADPVGLADGSKTAVNAVRNTIIQKIRGIRNRSAGIVLLFGGYNSQYPTYEQMDQEVENVLKSLSSTDSLFHRETQYQSFLNLVSAGTFVMDIYLFSGTS